MDEPWRRLAAAAGIEPGYWDGLGTRRDLNETTARALLASLGLDADVADARAIEFADWTTALPALVQVAPASSFGVDVTLPPDAAGQTLAWQIRLESGDLHEGSSALPHEHTAETRDIDGAVRTRFRLTVELAAPLAPGYHRLILPDHNAAAALLAVPARCHIPAFLAAGGRCWGLAVQLYSLRSARNWGIGDFTDLARIATIAGHAGAALIGLNPLHARHLARPDDASPYAPSSRLALDPMLLDIEAIAEFATCDAARAMVAAPAFQARLNAARATELVDHAAVAALKLPVLALLFDHFRARPAATDTRSAAYTAFVARGGADLEHFATFEARRLWLLEQDGKLAGWRDWPADWQDPHGACVRAFRAQHAASVEFQFYLQWQADLQLQAAARAATAAGMRIGLYRDLAVGAAADGAECWSGQDLIARDASVGAPPDLLNREGQDWGLPPWNPRVLLRREYAPLRTLLMENMRAAGALRIDHVMALTRLFWIPAGMRGAAGGYVRNAFEILAGIVAIESVRNQCMIIGEDLGSVPDGLRDALAARGFLSYRVLLFERHWSGDGSFKRPWEYPAQALSTVVTHDMPTIAEYWSGGDIARRDTLGLFPEPALREAEVARREPERQALLQLLTELGLAPGAPPAPPALTAALHAAVARCHAMLAVVQLDDISGETEPVNIPGTHLEYPNWRRKLALDIEDLAADPRFAQLADTMRGAGRA